MTPTALSTWALLTLMAWALLHPGVAHAHRRYAIEEGARCKTCHVAPEGGGPRTLLGQYFQATKSLPVDRSPQTMQLVKDSVDRWLLERISTPPVIRYRPSWPPAPSSTTTSTSPATTTAPSTTPASPAALLRRLSLDLRQTIPTVDEVRALHAGKSIAAFVDDFIASDDFQATFLLYHLDLLRPREGIYDQPPSFSQLVRKQHGFTRAWRSEYVDACSAVVDVSPWWDRSSTLPVCAESAGGAIGDDVDCSSDAGQRSGRCGCGPHLVHCYPEDHTALDKRIQHSMKLELSKNAMAIVDDDDPYGDVLTADWTFVDGALEVFYAKVWGTQSSIKDADADRPWRRIQRAPHHGGGLASPATLSHFYNGRRWAQRVFETYLCHEVIPDFDLLDDVIDAGLDSAVPYRDNPQMPPSLGVTEERACAACHLQLDALARVKDRFDPFGRYHQTDSSGLTIFDTAVFEGHVVEGVDGFGRAVAASATFDTCVTRQLWRHFMGHDPTAADAKEMAEVERLSTSFRTSRQSFRTLVRHIVMSEAYQGANTIKLMRREHYTAAMSRATGILWRIDAPYETVTRPIVATPVDDDVVGTVGDAIGWDHFYDKVGGMDYRRVERRDTRPSVGAAMVQHKAAVETCAAFVAAERARPISARRWLQTDDADAAIDALFLLAMSRVADDVDDEDRAIVRALYDDVIARADVDAALGAVCVAVFGAADFAAY